MSLILACNTYKRYELCVEMIRSAQNGTLKPDAILIIDNGGTFASFAAQTDVQNIEIHTPDENLGCSRAWNRFLDSIYDDDVLIIVNDDVIFAEDTIEKLYNAYRSNPNEVIYITRGSGLNAFSLFLATKRLVQAIGYFDEHFLVPYYEDNDLAYRIHLAGKTVYEVDCTIAEHVGSATIAVYTDEEMTAHHKSSEKNKHYYIAKWGGLPNHETYTTPFDTGIDCFEWHTENAKIV